MPKTTKYPARLQISETDEIADAIAELASQSVPPRDRAVVMRQCLRAGLPLVQDYYRDGGLSTDDDVVIWSAGIKAKTNVRYARGPLWRP